MKTDLVDVNDTRKNLRIEIPSETVAAEIERVARDYGRRAKVPGFRPGKAPSRVVKQRFKEQILHDVAHDLIPGAVDHAMRERGVEPVDTPDIQDVTIEEGQALTFTASFDTLPPFELGTYESLSLRRPTSRIEDEAVDKALEQLRDRAARYEPVEGRGAAEGDTVLVDLDRRFLGPTAAVAEAGAEAAVDRGEGAPAEAPGTGEADTKAERGERGPAKHRRGAGAPGVDKDHHTDVSVDIGSTANPPGFDVHLLGLEAGATTDFTIHYPPDYAVGELADTDVSYTVVVKAVKHRTLPALDDELAKDLGDFDTLDTLRTRVREDLEHEARHETDRAVRADMMKQLAAWLPFDVPASLVARELDRRLDDFARRLMEQQVDPRQAGIDWDAFRESQRDSAREAVAGTLVLEEIARREHLEVNEEEVEREVARYAERTSRTPAAVRAALEKEGGLSRVRGGLRREKSIDLVLSRATITEE